MLSLEHCKKVLGCKVKLSNQELATVREQLYLWASLTLDAWDSRKTSNFDTAKRLMGDPIAVEERAAIIEYEGNLSQDEAERSANRAHT